MVGQYATASISFQRINVTVQTKHEHDILVHRRHHHGYLCQSVPIYAKYGIYEYRNNGTSLDLRTKSVLNSHHPWTEAGPDPTQGISAMCLASAGKVITAWEVKRFLDIAIDCNPPSVVSLRDNGREGCWSWVIFGDDDRWQWWQQIHQCIVLVCYLHVRGFFCSFVRRASASRLSYGYLLVGQI